MTKAQPKAARIPLLVTTVHRGVFFGYGELTDQPTIRLEQARMCIYWSVDMHGVMGLAGEGPSKNCKVGPAVPAVIIRDVTAIITCTDIAAQRWEGAPWGK